MVYPFARAKTVRVVVEAMDGTETVTENIEQNVSKGLFECEFCGHNGFYPVKDPEVKCPRCGKDMERI